MERMKVKMNLIAGRSVRCATLNRKRSILLRKASELSTLCGQPVCIIVSDGLTVTRGTSQMRKVADIQEQLQNLDRENLHFEAMLQMRFKNVQRRIDSSPLSVSLDTNSLEDIA